MHADNEGAHMSALLFGWNPVVSPGMPLGIRMEVGFGKMAVGS